MKFELLQSKTESLTCKADNKFVHSKFDPVSEAQKYIQFNGIPINKTIYLLVFPGLNYAAKLLDTSWNSIFTIYSDSFFKENSIYQSSPSCTVHDDCYDFLKRNISCHSIHNLEIIFYQPVCRLFKDEMKKAEQQIKQFLNEAAGTKITISAFGSKWFNNIFKNFKAFRGSGCTLNIDKPVLLLGAGPSLEHLSLIRDQINKQFTVFTFASAVPILNNLNIHYEYVFHTDPGYYSEFFRMDLPEHSKIICPFSISSTFFRNYRVFPINTSLLCESFLFEKSGINRKRITDNGSVATTAVSFLKNCGIKEFYVLGLDFVYYDIKSHAEGHSHYNFESINASRLHPLHTKLYNKRVSITPQKLGSYYTGPSLQTYANWFRHQENITIKNLHTEHPLNLFNKESITKAANSKVYEVHLSEETKPFDSVSILMNYFDIIKKDIINLNSEALKNPDFFDFTLCGEFICHYFPEKPVEMISVLSETQLEKIKTVLNHEIDIIINRII